MDTPKHNAAEGVSPLPPIQPMPGEVGLPVRILEPLTPREGDVLRQVAQGLSNPEIARQLFISLGTVRTYLNNIYGKLQILGPFRRGKLIRFGLELEQQAKGSGSRPQKGRPRKSSPYLGA